MTSGLLAALLSLGALIVVAGGGSRSEIDADLEPTRVMAAVRVDTGSVSRASDRGRRDETQVDPAWASTTSARAGIPVAAIIAYGRAALRMGSERSDCHLSWNTLAGIGWIESQHGTIDERVLNADGTSTPPIIGPALNGDGFAAIRSTPESARWHGDPTWEHAVGPMQFIRSSWETWGSDGDGDGVADPMDLDDAAWSAARYLCADAHDLATPTGWSAAVHSYNHDNTYVLNVANAANVYARRAAG